MMNASVCLFSNSDNKYSIKKEYLSQDFSTINCFTWRDVPSLTCEENIQEENDFARILVFTVLCKVRNIFTLGERVVQAQG